MARNDFLVGVGHGSMVQITNRAKATRPMTREEALNLAAWLVVICEAVSLETLGEASALDRFRDLYEEAINS